MHRHHAPLVEVRSSNIPGAGLGVFVKRPIEKGRVTCLYPGIYTPGLPKHAAESEDSMNLADAMPPSDGNMEDNAYILNLNLPGGYIDGAALTGIDRWSLDGRRLDENPSACGHLVNHSSTAANVEVVSFQWREVLDEIDYNEKNLVACPNELRADGSPWYLDGFTGNIVPFPSPADVRRAEGTQSVEPILFGAAFCSQEDLIVGTEVLLDYQLKGPPYPSWAEEWYE
jgi:hypothetical protein